MKMLCVVGLLSLTLPSLISGHGYMYTPRSMNWVAHEDGKTWGSEDGVPSKEYCHHCLNRKAANEVCGDSGNMNYDNWLDSAGNPMPWQSEAVYEEGQIITINSYMSTHHYGHIELRLCPTGDSPSLPCFNNPKHLLEFVDDPRYGAPKDPSNPHYGHLSERSRVDYEMRFKLPEGVTGEKVLMQWKYVTANSCNPPGYLEYDWPDASWWSSSLAPCYLPYMEDGSRPPNKPEQFWNCARISITASGPTKSPSPTTTPSTLEPTTSRLPSQSPSKITAKPTAAPPPTMTPTNSPPTAKPTTSAPTTSSAPSSSSYNDYCCSWDFKHCGQMSWCNESPNNCPLCGGLTYMRKDSCDADKLAMYDDCTENEDACCAPLACQGSSQWYKQCLMPNTCAFDDSSSGGDVTPYPSPSPSALPSLGPSSAPQTGPSSTPSVSTDEECGDDPAYLWKGKAGKHCIWVSGNPLARCGKKGPEGFAYDYCKATCDKCPKSPTTSPTGKPTTEGGGSDGGCEDTPDYAFAGKPGKDCAWVLKKKKCGKQDTNEKCPKSCNTC